jgi:hypothetical protein
MPFTRVPGTVAPSGGGGGGVPDDASVTDAKVASGAAINLDKTADSATRLALTSTQSTKLAGVATGATANSSDATLLARANHTGSQTISTVTGLQTALDTKATLFGASDYSWVGWAFDPILGVSTAAPGTGLFVYMRVKVQTTSVITNVLAAVTTGAGSLTGAWAGVYSMAGTLLGTTADQSSSWSSTGLKTMALTTPTASQTAGTTVLVALLAVGGGPTFRAASVASVLNGNLTASDGFRYGGLASQTVLPSPLTLSGTSAFTGMPFVAIS